MAYDLNNRLIKSQKVSYLKKINRFARYLHQRFIFKLLYFFYWLRHVSTCNNYHFSQISLRTALFKESPLRSIQLLHTRQSFLSEINSAPHCGELVGWKFGVNSTGNSVNVVNSIVVLNNKSHCHNIVFPSQSTIDRILRANPSPSYIVEEPIVCLEYNTSHFGHFVAEVLGSLLFLAYIQQSSFVIKGFRILLIAPSSSWSDFIEELCPFASFLNLETKYLVDKKVCLRSCKVAPLLSSYQSLSYARNYTLAFLELDVSYCGTKNIFLCDIDNSRVHNLSDLLGWCDQYNFIVINPTQYSAVECLRLIHSAKRVISEQGSIILNCILARKNLTWVLTPSNVDSMNLGDYAGGAVFNSLGEGIIKQFYCKPLNGNGAPRKHLYSQKIFVDLNKLSIEIDLSR